MSVQVFMLGKWQTLTVVAVEKIGVYLGFAQNGEQVLLPRKQVPEGIRVGDTISVFLYKDSTDRLIATVHEPKITVGEIKVLQVKQVTKIGAFLDWGLEKDLLLPYGQQTGKIEEGLFYPVTMYVDKSERLAASMWIEKYMYGESPDEKKKHCSLLRMESDAQNVYVLIRRMGGALPYTDKADAEQIRKDFGLSKNAFKRAVGMLYKAHRLMLYDDHIELL